MKTSFLQWMLFLLACVAFAQEPFGNVDFSKFEKSLVADDSSSTDFEKRLMETPSEMEPVYKLREDLLLAIKSKDSLSVRRILGELSGLETRSMVPVHYVEQEAIYIDMKMFEDLLNMLVKYYRNALDTTRYDKNLTFASEDGLSLYVENILSKRDTSRNVYFSISEKIKYARISDAKKLKLEIMLLLRDAYRDPTYSQLVFEEVARFVNTYGDDPDAAWMKKCIMAPLSRMDARKIAFEERAERHEEVIEEKLYSGGLGLNLFFIKGGVGFGLDELYRKDVYDAVDIPINLELYLQISCVTFLAEILSLGVTGVNSYGAGFGLVVYDSRYIKVRPYVEYAFPGMELKVKKTNHAEHIGAGDEDLYGVFSGDNSAIVLAVNVDYKFGTPYFFNSRSKLTSFSIVGKFGSAFITLEDEKHFSGEGTSLFFTVGLGVYFW